MDTFYQNPRPELRLKQCPFCGSDYPELQATEDGTCCWVRCSRCFAQVGGNAPTYEQAAELWNKRVCACQDFGDLDPRLPGTDKLSDWDSESSASVAQMGLQNPPGFEWHPEQDQGDGGTSYFKLFEMESGGKRLLSIYPDFDNDGVRIGVVVKHYQVFLIIGKALTIKEAGQIVEDWFAKGQPLR